MGLIRLKFGDGKNKIAAMSHSVVKMPSAGKPKLLDQVRDIIGRKQFLHALMFVSPTSRIVLIVSIIVGVTTVIITAGKFALGVLAVWLLYGVICFIRGGSSSKPSSTS